MGFSLHVSQTWVVVHVSYIVDFMSAHSAHFQEAPIGVFDSNYASLHLSFKFPRGPHGAKCPDIKTDCVFLVDSGFPSLSNVLYHH